MSEFKFNDPFMVLEDSMADMRLMHSIQTGSMEITTVDGSPVDCWQFCNRTTGDVLTMSDAPKGLEYMVKSVLTIKNLEDKPIEFKVEGVADQWPWLTIVIDHSNQPYVEVAPAYYLGVPPESVSSLLDIRKYDFMATSDDGRHIPSDQEGGIDIFLTPTHPGYTLAAAAINESLTKYGDDTPVFMGTTPVTMKSGPVLEEYCMGVAEMPNQYDDSGFNKIFSLNVVSGTVKAIEVQIKKIGSNQEMGVAIGDNTAFRMGREGWVLRYKAIDDAGNLVERMGVPIGIGDDYIRQLFMDGTIVHVPLDD